MVAGDQQPLTGLIIGIGHGTMRDGPGWRSIVYFKGCNFRCAWCSSPDTLRASPEILFYPERVKYAERLAAACPAGALRVHTDGLRLDRVVCSACASLSCAAACVDGSIERSGFTVTVEEVMREILVYRHAHSNYGVTLSGGEATLQWNFFMALLQACRTHGLPTAVETNGSCPHLPQCFHLVDLMIIDLKHMNDETHRKYTGHGNADVLRNIQDAAHATRELRIRIPLVPGINDGKNIEDTIRFLLPLKDKITVEILGHHGLGLYKWRALGRDGFLINAPCPAPEVIFDVQEKLKLAGLMVISS